MLRPIIMIGCGGAGNKVVRHARDAVERQLKRAGWDHGVTRAWQFIGIDSNVFQEDSMVPLLPSNDFIQLARRFHTYQQLHDELMVRFGPQGIQPDVFDELMGWRPNPHQVSFPPFINGLGQSRAIGRAAGIVDLQGPLYHRIFSAFESCDASGLELFEVSRHLGVDVPLGQPVPNPIVLIVGSMAGGTGAGIMLDVVDLVRAVHVNGSFPTLVALTPDVFGELQNDGMAANSAAFMSELLNAYWDNEIPENGMIPPNVPVHTRGPHSVYVIGRRNLDGLDLRDSRNVYRAVGKVLAAITTSVRVQQAFNNYNSIAWPAIAANNAGGYGFAAQYLPGVASSFGSATISIGRDCFRDYMQKLLLRSIVEQLTHGYEDAAIDAFGVTEAKMISASKKIEDLAQRNLEKFLFDCGLEVERIGEVFFSNEEMRSQYSEISQVIKGSLSLSKAQSVEAWAQLIISQVQIIRSWNRETKSSLSDESIQLWISELYRRVLHSCNEFSAKLSLPVVLLILELVRADVMKSASVLRERAQLSRSNMANAEVKSRVQLNGSKGRVTSSYSLIQEAVSEIAKSIVWEWSANLQEKLAVALESVATSMLASIEAGLRNSNARLSTLVAPQDGLPPISEEWPKKDGPVPVSFTPNPVEFFLEDYTAWPQHARELIQQSLGDRHGLPIDPVDAARNLIIRGGFGKSSNEVSVNPLIWDEGNKSDPEWTSARPSFIRIEDSIAGLGERIDAWLSRPATEVNRVLTEGLAAYLSPEDPITCAPVADHLQRLKVFKEKLQLALMQSRPLIEIDESLNAVVHPRPISCSLNIGGFPFGEGHPARELTENVLQSFLGTAQPLDWAFTSSETELVSLTTFLEYPVNPSVITSFTEPLAGSINRMDQNLLSYSFWQWRRARTLQKFIPLPNELRIAVIRGFAIARAIGVMSAEVQRQNVIADRDGDKFFPSHLLTLTDRNNLLPALLEAIVLTFAEVSTKGKDAFAAYESLIEYGTGEGFFDEFQVGGLLQHFLDTGDYDGVRIVDQDRANSVVGNDCYQRAEKIIEYLRRNIERFEDLERSGPDPQSWRNQIGDVNPIDTLTLELLPDFRSAYGQVLDAVQKWPNQLSDVV